MIVQKIEAIVNAMTANGDSFTFLHGKDSWQNLQGDEVVFPAAFLFFPRQLDREITAAGSIRRKEVCRIAFLYKSQLDYTPEQIRPIIDKCHTAADEFCLRMYADKDNFHDFRPGRSDEWDHLYDVDAAAVTLPFEVYERDTVGCGTLGS